MKPRKSKTFCESLKQWKKKKTLLNKETLVTHRGANASASDLQWYWLTGGTTTHGNLFFFFFDQRKNQPEEKPLSSPAACQATVWPTGWISCGVQLWGQGLLDLSCRSLGKIIWLTAQSFHGFPGSRGLVNSCVISNFHNKNICRLQLQLNSWANYRDSRMRLGRLFFVAKALSTLDRLMCLRLYFIRLHCSSAGGSVSHCREYQVLERYVGDAEVCFMTPFGWMYCRGNEAVLLTEKTDTAFATKWSGSWFLF